MRTYYLSGLLGFFLLLTATLAGCSPFFTRDVQQEAAGVEDLTSTDSWLIAAQGTGDPEVCEKDLSRTEARKETKATLKEEEDAQALKKVLASLGKQLKILGAHGCVVKEEASSDSQSTAQGIRGQTAEEETILVEVPAGSDAALYFVESGDEGNYWASLKQSVPGGVKLVHMEVGLQQTGVQGLGTEPATVSFFLPDAQGTQDVVDQVKEQLQQGGGAASASLRAMEEAGDLDWSRAEVIVLDAAEGEDTEALLVVPMADSAAAGQALWGQTGAPINPNRPCMSGWR